MHPTIFSTDDFDTLEKPIQKEAIFDFARTEDIVFESKVFSQTSVLKVLSTFTLAEVSH